MTWNSHTFTFQSCLAWPNKNKHNNSSISINWNKFSLKPIGILGFIKFSFFCRQRLKVSLKRALLYLNPIMNVYFLFLLRFSLVCRSHGDASDVLRWLHLGACDEVDADVYINTDVVIGFINICLLELISRCGSKVLADVSKCFYFGSR